MWTDLRHAFRALKRSPGFFAVAVVTLGLGIGVNATVFSIIESLLLRPLPVREASRVVNVESNRLAQLSIPDFRDAQRQSSTLSALAAYRPTTLAVDQGNGAEQMFGYLVTGNYFDLLGITPARGRFFTPQEDVVRGGSPFAVLSHDSWQRRFNGDPRITGRTVQINGLAYTILGVLPRDFVGTEVFLRAEIWVPFSMQRQIEGTNWVDSRVSQNSLVIGRLKPGVTHAQALTDLNAVARTIAAAEPRTHEGFQFRLSTPGLMGSTGRTPASAFMTGVLALAGLVLLAACVNLASLLTSRLLDRQREMALRLSLGASRWRIARQVLVETTVLAAFGCTAGLALAVPALRLLSEWQPPLPIPVRITVTPDLWVFAFAAAVMLAVAVGASLAPARRAWLTDPARLTSNATVALFTRRWSLRDALLGGQVALCCLLVMTSLVAVRGIARAYSTPLGFVPEGLSAAAFDLAAAGYDGRTGTAFKRRLLDEIAATPGMTSAAIVNSLPLTADQNNSDVFRDDDAERRQANAITAALFQASPGYFGVAGTRLLAGRDIGDDDRINTRRVAVVNTAFARRVMRTSEPVGKRFRFTSGDPIEVVGMVETGKYYSLTEDPRPTVFLPAFQSYNSSTTVIVRSSMNEARAAAMIGDIVQRLDPRLPLSIEQGVSSAIGLAYMPSQVAVTALGVFGVLALTLAIVGIYGLAAYSVSARIRELGIRLAIGASRWQVLRSVLGRSAALLGAGSLVGIALGTAAQGALDAVVYQASARDPLLVVGVAGVMLLIGLAATWMPARRALGIDPAQTLRG
jgi:predicted permease